MTFVSIYSFLELGKIYQELLAIIFVLNRHGYKEGMSYSNKED